MIIEVAAIGAAAGTFWNLIEEPVLGAGKKLVGKVVSDKVTEAAKDLKHRFRAVLPLPKSSELVRGLRDDYLLALAKTLRFYKASFAREPLSEGVASDDHVFASVIQDWLDARIHPVTGKGVDYHAVTEGDVVAALDHLVHPSIAERFADQGSAARANAESRILAEIGVVWSDEFPERFLRWFKGGDDHPGWYDLFALYVNERIKTDERFRWTMFSAELVDIKRLLEEVDRRISETTDALVRTERILGLLVEKVHEIKTKLDSVDVKVERVEQKVENLDAVMQTFTAGPMAAMAAQEGLAVATIRTLAGRLRPGEELDLYQAVKELEKAVETAIGMIRAGERGTNETAFVNAVLLRVAEKLKVNDIDGAARDLDEELAANAERGGQVKRDRVALLQSAVNIDLLKRDPEAVASRTVDIVTTENASDRSAQLLALQENWRKYFTEGEQRGLNLQLEVAIAIARRAVSLCIERNDLGYWNNNLARSLATLGERDRGNQRLEEAIAVYKVALEIYPRGGRAWAMLQNNLGVALSLLGKREVGTKRLYEAAAAFRIALGVSGRKRADWAWTNSNLAGTLITLYWRENRLELLTEAMAACETSLMVFSFESTPAAWAAAQNCLSTALACIGRRDRGSRGQTAAEGAVAACHAAFRVYTREDWPGNWAIVQYNLGMALHRLGERDAGTERLELAASAFRSALLERTRDRVPLEWAVTQLCLGEVLVSLSERESGTERLNKAVKCFEAALEEFDLEPRLPEFEICQSALEKARQLIAIRSS